MTQWTHIQCFPLCVGICACEPLLPLWVHLGGSSLGSCALIRSTTGQLGITPSVTTNSTWEMVRVCESQRLRAARSPQSKHRVGSMKWDLVFNQTLISPTSFHNILWIIILILCLCKFWLCKVKISITVTRVNLQHFFTPFNVLETVGDSVHNCSGPDL